MVSGRLCVKNKTTLICFYLTFFSTFSNWIFSTIPATPTYFNSTKPKGTDDDFKTAACAGSLVKVAQKFVGGTGKQLQKRFTVAK